MTKNLFEERLKDPKYKKMYVRECFIENFLNDIDKIMHDKGISRSELAKEMGCTKSKIKKIMNGTKKLTAADVSDMAFCLDLEITLTINEIEK